MTDSAAERERRLVQDAQADRLAAKILRERVPLMSAHRTADFKILLRDFAASRSLLERDALLGQLRTIAGEEVRRV